MSRKQFRSEEEMHEAQKAFAVTTKLKASGEDVHSVLRINQKFNNMFLLLLFYLNTHYVLLSEILFTTYRTRTTKTANLLW